MGNAGHKKKRSSSGSSQFRRWFRRIAPVVSAPSTSSNDHVSLIPCTNHDGECSVCLENHEVLLRFSACSHTACTNCWLTFICTEIEHFAMGCLTCIACKERLAASTIIHMLTSAAKDPIAYGVDVTRDMSTEAARKFERALKRYEEFLLRQALAHEPDMRWCPSACGYGLIAHGFQACPQLVCPRPECYGRSFCYRCQRPWSSNSASTSADDAPVHVCPVDTDNRNDTVKGIMAFLGIPQLRSMSTNERSRFSPAVPPDSPGVRSEVTPIPDPEVNPSAGQSDDEEINLTGRRRSSEDTEVKPCPNCKSLIQKSNDGHCNSMVCTICLTNFCWLCLQPIKFGHYSSFAGCTLWGKKRLRRRHRLLILLGMMLGMPMIIILGVVLGVPVGIVALIIASCSSVNGIAMNNKHLRRFYVFCTFISSLVWAPLVITLIALLLIPLCLGYTYIYMPITVLSSLCKPTQTPSALHTEQVTNYTVVEAV